MRDLKIKSLLKMESKKNKLILMVILFIAILLANGKTYGITYNGDGSAKTSGAIKAELGKKLEEYIPAKVEGASAHTRNNI